MNNHLTPLNLNPATSYLPRRSSAKYFHRKQSLRPCSEWERVVSYRLITGNLSYNQLSLKSHWLLQVLPYPDYCIKLNLYHLCYLLFDIFYLRNSFKLSLSTSLQKTKCFFSASSDFRYCGFGLLRKLYTLRNFRQEKPSSYQYHSS